MHKWNMRPDLREQLHSYLLVLFAILSMIGLSACSSGQTGRSAQRNLQDEPTGKSAGSKPIETFRPIPAPPVVFTP